MVCQFYSGTVFLYVCVYVTVLIIKEEEEKEEEEEEEKAGRSTVRIGGDFGFFCSVFAQP